jgi:hypothetical protein
LTFNNFYIVYFLYKLNICILYIIIMSETADRRSEKDKKKKVTDVDVDYELIQQYVDDKIKELKLTMIKYIDTKLQAMDEKIKAVETKGKEMVLSDQTRQDVRKEIYSVIKKDVAPTIEKAVAYMKYTTEDGNDIIHKYRTGQTQPDINQKRIGNGLKPTKSGENPLHSALFVFDGDD